MNTAATTRIPVPQPPPAPSATAAAKSLRPQKIIVSLRRNITGYYTVSASHALPNLATVKAYLPRLALNALSSNYISDSTSLEAAIQGTSNRIKPRVWTEAIAQAIAKSLSQQANLDTELLAVEGGGFLSLGNALFKLSAVDYIEANASKALPALRRTVIEDAKNEAATLVAAGVVKAEGIIAEARRRHQEITAEANLIRREHEAMRLEVNQHIPQWVREMSLPVKVYMSNMYINAKLHIEIKEFQWTKYTLGNTPATMRLDAAPAPAVKVSIWIPINPFYVRSIFIDEDNTYLPHMDSHACMDIGDAPVTLASAIDYHNLLGSISRAMSIVNLSSLLVGSPKIWVAGLSDFIPTKLKPALNQIVMTPADYLASRKIGEEIPKPPATEAELTFTI